jgi:DNA-binding response OmpR family regulator
MTRKILIVEDNPDIAKLVSLHLKDLDYEVTLAADGLRGLHEARARRYDLIILDIMLPGLDGLELCRRLRAEIDYTPILMLTAKSSEVDRVVGLEIGADERTAGPGQGDLPPRRCTRRRAI